MAILIAAVYATGFLATWIVATRYWIARFGRSEHEQIIAAAWGIVVAIVWPVFAACLVMGKAVDR